MTKTKENYIGWIDLLRIIACFLVVLAHCCDPFVARFNDNYTEFLSGALWGSFLRPCVPLFVMMTGVLMFPVKMEMGAFYKKRITRIVIPLIFWSIVLPLLYFSYFHFGATTQSPSLRLDEITMEPMDYTFQVMLTKLYTWIFNFNYDTTVLWYLYMLIGLYLVIPVVNVWLMQASQKDIKLVLKIWFITLFLPYIQIIASYLGYSGNYGNTGILGVCDWNPYGTFYYFSGFLGYILLAHYLVRFPLNWSWKKIMSVSIPLHLVGYAITALGFIIIQKYYVDDYAYLEIFWYFSGINVFLMTFPIFIIIQNIKIKDSAFLRKMAPLAFGIFLCHFFFVQVAYDLLYPLPIAAALKIPAIACLAYAMSYVLVWIMSKFRLTQKFIM